MLQSVYATHRDKHIRTHTDTHINIHINRDTFDVFYHLFDF